MRETLYERQSGSRRVRLHHRIAQALEELGPLGATPAELAHHFFESRHLDREGKAIEYAVQAGDAGGAALAYEEADAHYAARAGAPARRRAAALRAAARRSAPSRRGRATRSPRPTFTRAPPTIARAKGFPELLARGGAGRRPALVARRPRSTAPAIALLEEALAALERRRPAACAAAGPARQRLHFAGEAERVDDLSARALELARRSGDAPALRRPRWRAATPRCSRSTSSTSGCGISQELLDARASASASPS